MSNPIDTTSPTDDLSLVPASPDAAPADGLQAELPLDEPPTTKATPTDEVTVDGIPPTDWFPPEIQPAHIGVYKTKILRPAGHGDHEIEIGYSYWDGKNWGPQFDTPKGAEVAAGSASFPCEYHWRGIAAEHPEHQL